MLKLSNEERETIINWNQSETDAHVYTFDSRIIRRLETVGVEIRVNETTGAVEATIPKKWIKINPPRVLSEEQRKIAAERLKSIRK